MAPNTAPVTSKDQKRKRTRTKNLTSLPVGHTAQSAAHAAAMRHVAERVQSRRKSDQQHSNPTSTRLAAVPTVQLEENTSGEEENQESDGGSVSSRDSGEEVFAADTAEAIARSVATRVHDVLVSFTHEHTKPTANHDCHSQLSTSP